MNPVSCKSIWGRRIDCAHSRLMKTCSKRYKRILMAFLGQILRIFRGTDLSRKIKNRIPKPAVRGGEGFFQKVRGNFWAMSTIFSEDLPLDIWDLKKTGRPYGDPFSALGGAWKSKKYPNLRILHTWWDHVEWWRAPKNELWLTNVDIESDLRVAWSPRLFQVIDMIITKYLSTDSMSCRWIENFLRASQGNSSFQLNSPFWDYNLPHWLQKESFTGINFFTITARIRKIFPRYCRRSKTLSWGNF